MAHAGTEVDTAREATARAAADREVTAPAGARDLERSAEAKRKIVNRLRRAHGQLAAVIAAVERDSPCRDVVQQLAAVSKAIDRAGYLMIATALQECLSDPDSPDGASPEELEKLFLTLA